MTDQKPRLPLLEQREIEARIVGPLIRAFAAEIGEERTLAIVRPLIRELARESGGELARLLGEQTMEAFAKTLGRWQENDALEIEILEQSPERLSFNVTRCRYAEMYRALGLQRPGRELVVRARRRLGRGLQSRHHVDPHPDDHGRHILLRFPVSTSRVGQNRRMTRPSGQRVGLGATRSTTRSRPCRRRLRLGVDRKLAGRPEQLDPEVRLLLR